MFKLLKADIQNKTILDYYLKYNYYPGCELSAANNILWGKYYQSYFFIVEDMLVFCRSKDGTADNITAVSFPIGEKNHQQAFDILVNYFNEHERDFNMFLVQPEAFEKIEEWYPGKFEIKYNRDDADYLYERKTLVSLAGKKLHGKRNHINRFLEMHPDYDYELIDSGNYRECIEFAVEWENNNNEEKDPGKTYERDIIEYALNNMTELGLKGALIKIDGKVVAFTIGEPLTKDTFVIHFEKAKSEVQGAYPMINKEFAKRELDRYKYINREEDMGIPGLRHAKTSYQPIKLVEKGIVTEKKSDS